VISSTAAIAQSKGVISHHHLEVIKNACRSMYPDKRIKRVKCRHQMRKEAKSLFNFNNIPSIQIDKILMRCEGLKYAGDGEDRLVKYDQCLRDTVDAVAPETVALPPKLAIKPYILLDTTNCQDFPGKAEDVLNTYKIKFEEYLENHVRGIISVNNKLIKEFWCLNKPLYFKQVQKKHMIDRKFYAVILFFKSTNEPSLDLVYELYDIKRRAFLYTGRVNSKPLNLSQAPSEVFKLLKNARNQILHQIIKYNPSN
jgi:hypothetical protein